MTVVWGRFISHVCGAMCRSHSYRLTLMGLGFNMRSRARLTRGVRLNHTFLRRFNVRLEVLELALKRSENPSLLVQCKACSSLKYLCASSLPSSP